jgi:hypothetical protein
MIKNNFILILAVLVANCTQAQTTKDLETDRPDQTETAFSVGKNMFQAESGYSVSKLSNALWFTNKVSLLRYGLSEKFELRTEIAHDIFDNRINQITKGIAPIEIGFKVNLVEEKGIIPKTSLITHLALPKAASAVYKGSLLAPSFRFSMQHTIGKRQSLSYNIGGETAVDDKKLTPLYTLATGYDFSNWVYGYLELFGFFPQQQLAEHSFAGGFAFLVKPNVQFDISGGVGITKTAPKNYWAIGLSFRLPK